MEICRWHCYFVINIAIIVPYLAAKPVSLNKIIAAEIAQQTEDSANSATTIGEITSKLPATQTSKRFSLNPVVKAPSIVTPRKFKGPETLVPLDKKIPLLKYRKTYEIKSPLKPKKLKHVLGPRYKRKNKSIKRDIHEYEKFNHRYIPLLKSVGMLFDNLLDTSSSETYETNSKYKRNRDDSGERKRVVCSCALRSASELKETDSGEKTTTSATTNTPEVTIISEDFTLTETTTAPADHSAASDVCGLGQNKDVPLLLPRNTVGFRRDNNGYSEGSGAAYNGDIEGNIARDHGDGEYFTSIGENGSDTGSNEENSNGHSRDDASSDGFTGSGNVPTYTRYGNSADENDAENENTTERQNTDEPVGRHLEFKRDNKQQIRGDEAKSTKHVSEPIRRLRGPLSPNKVGDISKSIQFEENNEESVDDDTFFHTSSKRFSKRRGTNTADDQKVRSRHENVMPGKDVEGVATQRSEPLTSKKNAPIIMIIDGYSVTRDKNGENKMAEKSVRLHSK